MLVTILCIVSLTVILVCLLVAGDDKMRKDYPDYDGEDLYDLDDPLERENTEYNYGHNVPHHTLDGKQDYDEY